MSNETCKSREHDITEKPLGRVDKLHVMLLKKLDWLMTMPDLCSRHVGKQMATRRLPMPR